MPELIDSFGRKIIKLRISVTDRCPLNCIYCNPEAINFIPREQILRLEEIHKIAKIFSELGIDRVRITGGEPLYRKGITSLIKNIKDLKRIDDIALTTNGQELARYASELKKAGLNRINISLDSLIPEKYKRITGGGILEKTLDGIKEAQKAGLKPIKINTVIIRGINDDEIEKLIEFSNKNNLFIRFIELMSYNGNLKSSFLNKLVRNEEIKERLSNILSNVEKIEKRQHEELFIIDNGRKGIGFISPESESFCSTCNKLRLTSWGELLECLYSEKGLNLRDRIRSGIPEEKIKQEILEFVKEKCYSKYGKHNINMKNRGG